MISIVGSFEMKTMAKRGILAGAAAVALSFCALTAFAAPTIESNSAGTASSSPRSALSENSPSNSTVLTVDKNGGDGVYTKLQDALDAIPDNAGDVTILVNSSINQDYNEFRQEYRIPYLLHGVEHPSCHRPMGKRGL